MNGAVGGLSGTSEVVIKLLDINDNIPTLEQESVRATQLPNTLILCLLQVLLNVCQLCQCLVFLRPPVIRFIFAV